MWIKLPCNGIKTAGSTDLLDFFIINSALKILAMHHFLLNENDSKTNANALLMKNKNLQYLNLNWKTISQTYLEALHKTTFNWRDLNSMKTIHLR